MFIVHLPPRGVSHILFQMFFSPVFTFEFRMSTCTITFMEVLSSVMTLWPRCRENAMIYQAGCHVRLIFHVFEFIIKISFFSFIFNRFQLINFIVEKTCVKGREKKKSLTICTRQIVRIIKEDKNQKKLFNSFEVLLPQSDSKLKFAQYTTKTMKVTLLPKNGDETTPKKKVTVAIFEWEFPEKEFDKKEKELMAEIVKHKATICQP